ncbi:MAG TPA: response regulator, partial [Gaiellaceae bacterium]|nr:response regulator [Gaiellaceae bacterium]
MSDLPRGTVTLFFADVEGSTRLAAEHGEDWGALLTAVRASLRQAVAAAGGVEVDARGDELFAAFGEAEAAAAAAEAATRALIGLAGAEIRVRIGLHTGSPLLTDDGYVGVDVHRASRIANAGHGGQVLLSERTAKALVAREPRDLGLYALPDLADPERIFQLGEGSFPPLRARPGTAAIRLSLADDSVLLREGLARLLGDAGFDVVSQAGNAEDLLRHVAMHRPDVAIVDIRMPPTHTDEGLVAAQAIRERHPDVGVLVLSQYVEPAYALELLGQSAEGVGYLLKDRVADIDAFVDALRRVAGRGSVLDPEVVSQLLGRRRAEARRRAARRAAARHGRLPGRGGAGCTRQLGRGGAHVELRRP